jgi:hypothetical protein
VAYKINVDLGKLYVADPNFSGSRDPSNGAPATRVIDFINGGFAPFSSSLSVNTNTILFDEINYLAKTAYVSRAQYLMLKPGEYSFSWSANSFNFDFRKNTYGYYEWDTTLVYGNMKGELSADGNTILWLTGYKVESNLLGTDRVNYKLELSNLQYRHMTEGLIYYDVRGPGTASVVNKVEISRRWFTGAPWNEWVESHLVSVDYNSSSSPFLTVEFFPKN